MKGVIMRVEGRKSIVLFNNGTIGAIPTPPHCQEGAVITVSFNKKRAALFVLLVCAILVCAVFAARFFYFTPAGYLHIALENGAAGGSAELAYNRASRVIAFRPLDTRTAAEMAEVSIRHKKLEDAYADMVMALAASPNAQGRFTARVRIAHDNLAKAKEIERALSLLSEPLMAASSAQFSTSFELYTLELYRAAMSGERQNAPPQRLERRHHMMRMRENCW
jgi:hypothetical protein